MRILGALQLGLTGQPLVSLDIGGCAKNITPKLLQFGGANDVKKEASTIDVNFSGSLAFENSRLPYHHQITLQFGVLNCETALPRSRLRWRFDKKWAILTTEGFFSYDRGGCIISHDFIAVNFVSAAFDLYIKVQTSYSNEFYLERDDLDGVDLHLQMVGIELFNWFLLILGIFLGLYF